MVALFKREGWWVIASSRQGATHQLRNVCNQDAVAYNLFRGGAVVAIADGHGSSKSPYSDRGAQIAVNTACRHLKRFMRLHTRSRFEVAHQGAAMLPVSIVHSWRREVARNAQEKGLAVADNSHSVWLRFGCTLVAAALHPEWILLLQLGDGDILMVEGDDRVSRFGGSQPEALGEATHSLCEPNADARMEWRLLPIVGEKPLLLLCTDGYSKSFATQDDFLKAGSDWRRLLKESGAKQIKKHMDEWLDETSKLGSGDDVTVAVVYWHSSSAWINLRWFSRWRKRQP